MGESAFRRLLLDTVATVITQPPSSTSLIELLRIASPSLLASSSNTNQRRQAGATIRDASKREKLFRTLQLRIHPDKHDGDSERATVLFQEVTLFYERCINAMEREDERQRRLQQQSDGGGNTGDVTTAKNNDRGNGSHQRGDDEEKGSSNESSTSRSQFPQWYPWWYRHHQNPRDDNNPQRSSTNDTSTHSDYENFDYERNPHGRNNNPLQQRNNQQRQQPSTHQAFAVLSTILFPPLGICALFNSFLVRRAWNDGRYGDARDHSDQAYSYAWFACLCFVFLVMYLWLSDGDADWDWDRMKHNFPWNDGP